MKLTFRYRGGNHEVEVEHDPTFTVDVDGKAVVGVLLDHGDNAPLYNIGHWPDGEEWVPLVEAAIPRPYGMSIKPEFEHFMLAVLETWSGSTGEDFDRTGPDEYLRGQVELLVQAGAVRMHGQLGVADEANEWKIQWLTGHIITEVLLATERDRLRGAAT